MVGPDAGGLAPGCFPALRVGALRCCDLGAHLQGVRVMPEEGAGGTDGHNLAVPEVVGGGVAVVFGDEGAVLALCSAIRRLLTAKLASRLSWCGRWTASRLSRGLPSPAILAVLSAAETILLVSFQSPLLAEVAAASRWEVSPVASVMAVARTMPTAMAVRCSALAWRHLVQPSRAALSMASAWWLLESLSFDRRERAW